MKRRDVVTAGFISTISPLHNKRISFYIIYESLDTIG